MADYRDDRGALRQRVTDLEAELERSREANTALEAELRRAREEVNRPAEPEKKSVNPPLPMLVIVGGVTVFMLVVAIVRAVASNSPQGPPASGPLDLPEPIERDTQPMPMLPVDDSKEPSEETSAEPDPPPDFVEAKSCRCEGGGAPTTLAYRVRRTTKDKRGVTSFVEAELHGSRRVELMLGSETVPADSFDAKNTRLLVACDSRYMVLAFGQRVSAWNRTTGDPTWIATLPAPVGRQEPGPFALECVRLPVTDGAITLAYGGGSTRLSMMDGEPVQPGGDR